MTIEEKVREILTEQLGCEKEEDITLNTKLSELGADSLDILEITMDLEREFIIDIDDEEMEKLLTVGDIVTFVEEATA